MTGRAPDFWTVPQSILWILTRDDKFVAQRNGNSLAQAQALWTEIRARHLLGAALTRQYTAIEKAIARAALGYRTEQETDPERINRSAESGASIMVREALTAEWGRGVDELMRALRAGIPAVGKRNVAGVVEPIPRLEWLELIFAEPIIAVPGCHMAAITIPDRGPWAKPEPLWLANRAAELEQGKAPVSVRGWLALRIVRKEFAAAFPAPDEPVDLLAVESVWAAIDELGIDAKIHAAPLSEVKAAPLPETVNDQRAAGRNRGGRPPKWDWAAFDKEMIRLANHPDGLPQRLDLTKHMLNWCVSQWGDHPADSEVRKRISERYPAED